MEKEMKPAPISVAIVEDDEGLRESMLKMIERPGDCRCVGSFADAETALEKLPSLVPDVVLMDINLPGMSGVDCVERLSDVLPGAHILMVTVFKDTDSIFKALAAGAVGYLLKPVRTSELLSAVRDAHAGGAPMTGSIARKVVEVFRVRPGVSEMESLTEREADVLRLLAEGYLYKEISEYLSVSSGTVNTLVFRIYAKLHVHTRREAVARYLGRIPRDESAS